MGAPKGVSTPRQRNRLYHRNYKLLENAALQAIIAGKKKFTFKAPASINVEFPQAFPKRKLVESNEQYNKYEISCKELLDFLFESGRITYKYGDVMTMGSSMLATATGMITGLELILNVEHNYLRGVDV